MIGLGSDKNDGLEKPVRFWFRLHFLSRISRDSTTFPRSLYDESCNAIADKNWDKKCDRFQLDITLYCKSLGLNDGESGEETRLLKGRETECQQVLVQNPQLCIWLPRSMWHWKTVCFRQKYFCQQIHFAANKYRNYTNHFCILKIILKCVLFRILPQISIKSRCPAMRFHDNTCWHSSGSALDWPSLQCLSI